MAKNIFTDDFISLRDKKDRVNRLEAECMRLSGMEVPALPPKKSTTYMGIAIFNLSLMYRVSEDRKYLDEAIRWIDAVVSYPDWGNAHLVNLDLSAAWILFGLSIGYDWLKDDLGEDRKRSVEKKISYHSRLIYDYASEHRSDSWPIEYWQNHNWIDYTGLAAAGYALKGIDEMADRYTEFALADFRKVFSLLSDDGSNYEGVVYWRYGGMWLFVYAYMVLQMEGIDFFSASKYLRNTFYYKLYQSTGSLCRGIDYGDCHDHLSSNPVCVYYLVARMYRDGYAQSVGNRILDEFFNTEAFESKVKPGLASEAGFELIWFDPSVCEKSLDSLPLYRFFPDLGLLSVRESWERNSKVFSFKCSAPGGKKQWHEGIALYEKGIKCLSLSHHHPDNQAFFLVRGDDYLTLEDGYNRNIMPGAHNTILVDGRYADAENCNDVYMSSIKMRLEENPGYSASAYGGNVDYFLADKKNVMLSSENKEIYPLSLRMNSVVRKVFCYQMRYIVMFDILSSEDEHLYTVINNSDAYPETSGNSYFYRTHGAYYQVFSDRNIKAEMTDVNIRAVMTTQEPDNYTERFIKSLRHTSAEKCREQVFVHVIHYDDVSLSSSFEDGQLKVVIDGKTHLYIISGGSVKALLDDTEYNF